MKNPKKFWFKSKRYGFGWYPASREGWFTLAVFVVAITWNAIRIDSHSHSASDTLINFIPQTFVLVLLLIAIAYATGEKLHFQWGESKKQKD